MSNYAEILMEYERCCRENPISLASIGVSVAAGMIPEMIKVIRLNRMRKKGGERSGES
jgi:hypothetical protein